MHILYFYSAFGFCVAQTVAASGAGNVTADADGFAPPWVANPQGRGTLTIVVKCVTTLLLAAWVPLHLNIPSFEQNIGARFGGFGFWATFTFLIPEWVVYIASEQWRQMWKFLGEMEKARKELYEKQKSGISHILWLKLLELNFARLKPYTWAYGWCATMGYFTISLPHPRDSHSARATRSIFPENRRVTFTAFGIISLAKLGVVLHVPDSAIPHNTPADYILKGVSLCQVLWFLCTVVLRKAAGLPLALLEISTLIRVACGIAMYLLWWKKPANLQTTLNCQVRSLNQTVPKMLAQAIDQGKRKFCLTNSGKLYALVRLDMRFNHQHLFCCFCTKEWDASKIIIQQGGARAIIYALEKDTVLEEPATADGHELWPMAANKLAGQLSTLERTPLMSDLKVTDSGALDLTAECSVNHTNPLAGAEVERRDEENRRPWTNKRSSPPSTHAEDVGAPTFLMVEIAQGFVKPTIPNFSWFRISSSRSPAGRCMLRLKMEDVSWRIIVGYILILAYAGIHLATHYAGFTAPTPVEGLMWNISCYLIVSWVAVFISMEIYFFTSSRISGRRAPRYDCWNPAVWTYDWSIWKCLPLAAFFGAVLCGRLFLMVEAFISQRKEKVEVFYTPSGGWWFG